MTPDVVKAEIATAERMACEALMRGDNTERGTIIRMSDVIGPIQALIRNLAVLNGDDSIGKLADAERISLVISTNRGLLQECSRYNRSRTGGALLGFPAQELVRGVLENREPCNWKKRWAEEGGKLYKGRMIALAWDGIWCRLSQFGIPAAPLIPGSGMTIKYIARREAIEAGVMTRETQTEPVAQITYLFTDWTID